MADMPRFRFPELILLLAVVAAAAAARAWYVLEATNNGLEPAPFQVQGFPPPPDYQAGTRLRGQLNPNELDALAHNVQMHRWFGSLAPLSDSEEKTANVAPGYPWLLARLAGWFPQPDPLLRWGQLPRARLTA